MTIHPEVAVAVAAADSSIGLNGESPQPRWPAPRASERDTSQQSVASQVGSGQILGDPNPLSGNRFVAALGDSSRTCRDRIETAIVVAKGG